MRYVITKQWRIEAGVGIVLTALIYLLIFSATPNTGKTYSDPRLVPLSDRISHASLSQGLHLSYDGLSKGKFLVASRNMQDPRFMETVVLLLKYDTKGATGLIINRPTEVKISEVFPDIAGPQQKTAFFLIGGPVAINQVFILLRSGSPVEDAENIFRDVHVSPYMSVLRRVFSGNTEEENFRVYAGYAGWMPGQLDLEVSRGDWHILQADAETIFKTKLSEIWSELISRSTSLII